MTLNIELTPRQEAHLTAVAQRERVAPTEILKRLLTEHLPPEPQEDKPDTMLALFAQWDNEDQRMTTAEIAEEIRTWEEFKININTERDRAGARKAF